MTVKPRSARWGRAVQWATLAAALAAACAVLGITILTASGPGVVDMNGRRVELDPGTVPPAAVQRQMDAVDDVGQRFVVPSVRLDVPLGELSSVENTITPPGFTSAYAVRNLGAKVTEPSSGTVFVVTHAIRGGGTAPGNYLFDVKTGASALHPGDVITVAATRYSVTGSEVEAKTELPGDAAVWADTPNRLVVITCLEKPSGAPSTDNLVITATR